MEEYPAGTSMLNVSYTAACEGLMSPTNKVFGAVVHHWFIRDLHPHVFFEYSCVDHPNDFDLQKTGNRPSNWNTTILISSAPLIRSSSVAGLSPSLLHTCLCCACPGVNPRVKSGRFKKLLPDYEHMDYKDVYKRCVYTGLNADGGCTRGCARGTH